MFGAKFSPKPGIFVQQTPKFNSYASSTCAGRLPVGPIRQNLPYTTTGRTPRTRHLCVRIPRKTCAKQKEIGIFVFQRNFPIFVASFTTSYRPQRYLTAPAGIRPGGDFVYNKFGFTFTPSARVAISHTMSEMDSSFGITT